MHFISTRYITIPGWFQVVINQHIFWKMKKKLCIRKIFNLKNKYYERTKWWKQKWPCFMHFKYIKRQSSCLTCGKKDLSIDVFNLIKTTFDFPRELALISSFHDCKVFSSKLKKIWTLHNAEITWGRMWVNYKQTNNW